MDASIDLVVNLQSSDLKHYDETDLLLQIELKGKKLWDG